MYILCIDYGKSKIGLAIGDTDTIIAQPYKVIPNSEFNGVIAGVFSKYQIKKIIIGLPGNYLDSEIKTVGEKLTEMLKIPVVFIDETLTTQDAQQMLINSGLKRKNRKEKEDAVAAAIMLQYYLEASFR